ncbi:MAG: GH25 family lysozyme [Bacillota bacterium]|nr:GH25 family lysozyme [Bacillota bacterium]
MNRKTRKKDKSDFRKKITEQIDKKRIITVVILGIMILLIGAGIREGFYLITDMSQENDEKYPVKGIDVSKHQGEIDWEGIAEQGFEFAYIKATEGTTHVDSRFEYNWKNARKHVFRVGAYHFLSYDSPGDTQAANFMKTVPRRWNTLPPVVDVEFYGDYRKRGQHPSKEKMYTILDVILEKLENGYGKKPVIYTNKFIYQTYISGRYDDYDIWISDHSIPDSLSDGRMWTFCQYTFTGKSKYVSNGNKSFDADIFYGSKYKLRHY